MDPALALEVAAISRYRALMEGIEGGTVRLHYAGATAFVTGGSGFLGKQLIEKLIRSTDIKKIYLLLRPKKGKTIEERLENLLADSVYDELHRKQPDFPKKLVPVVGDVMEIRLGVSDKEWKMLCDEVEIIMHVAATVSFDEPIKMATLTNVRGTREAITLAVSCKKLKSFVHVSTAYSHATTARADTVVAEQFYDCPVEPRLLIEIAESTDESKLNEMTAGLLQGWPNTYTFTKAAAEELVRTSGDLPVCIVRPAVVIASHNEPSPAWIDASCATGASGIIIGGGTGAMHIYLARNVNMDLVPVDLVNNAIIAAGWRTACLRSGGDCEKSIYTVACTRNPISEQRLEHILMEAKHKYPSPKAMYYCFISSTGSKLLYFILSWLLHYIPAYLADGVCWIMGKPQRFVKLYKKADKLTKLLSHFTCHEWTFTDDNLLNMFKAMSPTDQIIYNVDVGCINWDEHVLKWAVGIRKYILKDGLKDTEYAIKKQFCLKLLHYSVVFLFLYVFWNFFSLFYSVLSYCLK